MKSKKLIAIGQRSRLQPEIDWFAQRGAAMTETASGVLLEMSFVDWCKSLRIKTDRGLHRAVSF